MFLSVSFMFISYKQLNRSEGMGVYFSCIFDLNDLLYKFTFNFFTLNDFFVLADQFSMFLRDYEDFCTQFLSC